MTYLMDFKGKTQDEIKVGYQSSPESRRINETFDKNMKDILKDMKL